MKNNPIIYQAACIFSLIGGITGFFIMLFIALFYNTVSPQIEKLTNVTSMDQTSPLYFAILMAVYGVSIAGIIQLLNRKRAGIVLYLVAQLCLILLPVLWLGKDALSVTNLVFTIVFLIIYLSYYKLFQ